MGEAIQQITNIIRHPISLSALIALSIYTIYARKPNNRAPQVPFGFLILFLVLSLLSPSIEQLNWPTLYRFFRVATISSLWFGIIRIAAYICLDCFIGQRKSIAIPRITRDLFLVILYVIACMIILRQELNVDITSLVATSAILTAVVGLALQETLGNLFSGLALNIEKPYKIGDWVLFDKYRGQVRGISWRSTTVVTSENENIVVPNNVVSRSHIVNYSDPSTHIVSSINFGVSYDTPPNKMRDVVFETLRANPEVLSAEEMECRLVDYADHAIKYEIRYWVDIKDDYESADRIKSEIMTSLWYRLRRANIRIPYPIRVQYQAREELRAEVVDKIDHALKAIELFTTLKPEERRMLAESIDRQEFEEGAIIVRQDDPGDCMYLIAEGNCAVHVIGPRGREIAIASLKAGEFFGEMSLMTGAARSATIKATSDAVLYRIEKGDMLALLEANPTITTTISEYLARRIDARSSAIAAADISEVIQRPPSAGQILQRIRSFFRIS